MVSFHHWNTLALSFCLSLAAVTGATFVQGSLLFRSDIAAVSEHWPCSVGRVSINTEQGAAVVAFRIVPPLGAAHRRVIGMYDLGAQPPVFEVLCPQLRPLAAITASNGNHAFVSTVDGRLYVLDIAGPSAEPVLLGEENLDHADLLECTPDGSIVVVGCWNVTMAWHRETMRLLWRRADLVVTCGATLAEPSRLICGTQAGDILEIDLASGVTLRKIATHDCRPFALAISPCRRYLAILDFARRLVMADLDGVRILWSCRSAELVGPEFTPDGKLLIVTCASGNEKLTIHCVVTGQVLGRLNSAAERIKGLTVSSDGKVYAWGVETGAITAWDLASGAIVYRLVPERDWHGPG